jgi:hypothetical protein
LTPPEGYTGDSINDALDDLLRQAAASLRHLDGIRNKLPTAQPQETRHKRSDANDFWKPRCRADLWGDDDLYGDSGSEMDSDLGSPDGTSSPGVEVEEEQLWDFLRAACKAEPAGPASKATPRKGTGAPSRPAARSQQPQPARSQRPTSEAPPRSEEKPADAPNERASANGFRFGTYGRSSNTAGGSGQPSMQGFCCSAGPATQKPEAQISSALLKAQANGPDAVRSTLKQMLLKWHPDKAPQGDSAEAVAARAESTRVLRYVLQERQRLGL